MNEGQQTSDTPTMEHNQEEIIDLDLYTLLPLLGERKETCILQTEVRHNLSELGFKGACTIKLRLDQGQVTHCSVTNHQQKAVEVDLTRFAIYRTRLSWRCSLLAPEQEIGTPSILTGMHGPVTAPMPVVASLPQRLPMTSNKETALLASLPRSTRHIFALVDGKRPVTRIAQMLSFSPKQVEEALKELRARGMIQ